MVNNRLGISIYPEIVGVDETIKYIELASKYGFKRIFANLLEIENNEAGQKKLKELSSVYKFAKSKNFEVILDINPEVYRELKLKDDEIDFFKNLGATGIRLDEDFGGKPEAKISNNNFDFKLEINASIDTDVMEKIIKYGGNPKNLLVCHNFYPMRYTGLKYERFIELSARFKQMGVTTAAFVTLPESQKGVGPWNVNEGMPTIEEHRDASLEDQVADLLSLDIIDDIIISQQGTTEEQFKKLSFILSEFQKIKMAKGEVISLKANYENDITPYEQEIIEYTATYQKMVDKGLGHMVSKTDTHANRSDVNGYFIRSTFTRLAFTDEIAERKTGKKLKYGDIVILNKNLNRYNGELHIITKDLTDSNNARNFIGRIADEDLFKLKFIKGGQKFKMV